MKTATYKELISAVVDCMYLNAIDPIGLILRMDLTATEIKELIYGLWHSGYSSNGDNLLLGMNTTARNKYEELLSHYKYVREMPTLFINDRKYPIPKPTDLERFKELFDSVGLNYFEGSGVVVDNTAILDTRVSLTMSITHRTLNIEDSNGEFSEFTFTPEGKFKEFNGLV